jgi:hypothetical protein
MASTLPIIQFRPDESPIASLFEKWRVIYTTQYELDDAEADEFTAELLEAERKMRAIPSLTMQEFFYSMTAASCFGQFAPDDDPASVSRVMCIAGQEAKERRELVELIDQHRGAYIALDGLLGRHDSRSKEYKHAGGDAIARQETDALSALISLPCVSIANVVLKGRYLAALQATGALGFEDAEAFVRSFRSFGCKSSKSEEGSSDEH